MMAWAGSDPRRPTVHPSAKECVQGAVASAVVGAALLVDGAQVLAALAEVAGANADVGLGLANIVPTLVSGLLSPTAAALIGAAVVIQALAPERNLTRKAEHAVVSRDEFGPDTEHSQ